MNKTLAARWLRSFYPKPEPAHGAHPGRCLDGKRWFIGGSRLARTRRIPGSTMFSSRRCLSFAGICPDSLILVTAAARCMERMTPTVMSHRFRWLYRRIIRVISASAV